MRLLSVDQFKEDVPMGRIVVFVQKVHQVDLAVADAAAVGFDRYAGHILKSPLNL